jgi:hypothetical protein
MWLETQPRLNKKLKKNTTQSILPYHEIGTLVLYQRNDSRPGEVRKFNEKWKGPYVVIDNSRKSTVKLKSLRAGSRARIRTFDASVRQIKLYHSDKNLPENQENESSDSEPEPEIESESEIESEPGIRSEKNVEYASMLNPIYPQVCQI